MSIPGFTAEMAVKDAEEAGSKGAARAKHHIRVPRFISGEIGLGDAISRAASAVGISPCGGCGRRAQALNAWVSFSPRR
jgi:hypothetical protein